MCASTGNVNTVTVRPYIRNITGDRWLCAQTHIVWVGSLFNSIRVTQPCITNFLSHTHLHHSDKTTHSFYVSFIPLLDEKTFLLFWSVLCSEEEYKYGCWSAWRQRTQVHYSFHSPVCSISIQATGYFPWQQLTVCACASYCMSHRVQGDLRDELMALAWRCFSIAILICLSLSSPVLDPQ